MSNTSIIPDSVYKKLMGNDPIDVGEDYVLVVDSINSTVVEMQNKIPFIQLTGSFTILHKNYKLK